MNLDGRFKKKSGRPSFDNLAHRAGLGYRSRATTRLVPKFQTLQVSLVKNFVIAFFLQVTSQESENPKYRTPGSDNRPG